MNVYRGLDGQFRNSVVSLGKFDGIHQGHRLLLEQILRESGIPTVFTFAGMREKQVYTEEEKQWILEEMGIEREIIFPFTEENKKMSPETFVKTILWDKLDTKFICVGEDFRFGNQRAGDVSFLQKACQEQGCRLQIFPKLRDEKGVISSTRIRELICQGEISQANRLLGRPWFLQGIVQHGRALGRSIQMPTANIVPAETKLLPPYGVYTSQVKVCGKTYYGVTNIGNKPTVQGNSVGIETNIFDFEGDLYGKMIQVNLWEFQRKEQKFSTIEALKEQMQQDKETARKNIQRLCHDYV